MVIDGIGAMNSAGAVRRTQLAKGKEAEIFANRPETAATQAERQQKQAKLKSACKDMEAVFLNMLLKEMRESVPKTNLLGEHSSATELMQSMLDSEMTKDLAKAGGIGVADMLYRQLAPTLRRSG